MYIKIYTKNEPSEISENLFDLSNAVNGHLSDTDAFTLNLIYDNMKTSTFIQVEPSTLYKYEVTGINMEDDFVYWNGWYFYKDENTVSKYTPERQVNSSYSERSKNFYIKTPPDANYIRISSRFLTQSEAAVKFVKMSPITYTYYDTIYDIGSPQTVNTLNGINKFSCTIPLRVSKMNAELVNFMNQIEFYDDDDILRFGGFLVDRVMQMPDITLNCYGYAYIFQKMRMCGKNYGERTYASLIDAVFREYIRDNNYLSFGFSLQVENNANTTTRISNDTDFVYDKMIEWVQDCGGYLLFDVDKTIKFQYEIPQSRMWFAKWELNEESNILELPTSFNNLITFPRISQSIIDTVNNMYTHEEIDKEIIESEETTEGEETTEDEKEPIQIVCVMNDVSSINNYGMLEGISDVNDSVVIRETVYEKTLSQLNDVYLAQNNISFEIADSILAPMNEIKVGQKITVYIEPYFNFKTTTTILEIQKDYTSATINLTVGTTLYRQNKPTVVNYK
jgi:hypothetical protein